MAAAEIGPLAQIGGLGDVLRALPRALARRGHAVRRFMPAYGSVDRTGFIREEMNLAVPLGPARAPVTFLSRTETTDSGPGALMTTLVENDELFAREGIYGPPGGAYDDNARRFTLLSRAVCEYARRSGRTPDVLHVHDWHTAIVPLLARFAVAWPARPPRTVLTVHNMGYQGRFGPEDLDWLSLRPEERERLFRRDGMEDHGGINFLKAGLVHADRIAAVSPTYAREIATPEGGFGLDAVVRGRGAHVVGILNGADYDLWNPETDRHLPRTYGPDSLAAKGESRHALRQAIDLPPGDRPMLGVVSRLVEQKGIDLVARAADDLIAMGADLAILGSGEAAIAGALERLRAARPDRVGLRIGYDERLSHLIIAGCDLFLMPSRYEPCGLAQMHAMRYGTVPVVRRTGGLADTVRDQRGSPGEGTGFVFDDPSAEALGGAVRRALALHRSDPRAWKDLEVRAMREDFSWDGAAALYEGIYEGRP